MSKKQAKHSQQTRALSIDPCISTQTAGLHYVSDIQPGLRRRRRGKGFGYTDVDGTPVRKSDILRRIKSLAIPPAWTDVWICPRPDGHLQATGRDAKGRKQYRYHPHWRIVRDTTKYDRLTAFGDALPQLRQRLAQDLASSGLPRDKVLATIVRLLETTLIRIGNVEYRRQNGSFGLTTMRDRHVQISGASVQFQFRGKGGKYHTVRLQDRRLSSIVKRCQDLPGYELFQYLDATGQRQTVDAADVNAYLRAVMQQDFTAKDIRTWAGTVLAACALRTQTTHTSQTQAQQNIRQVIEEVARRLGNTPAICRKCYVHPAVLEAYLDCSLFAMSLPTGSDTSPISAGLYPEEMFVLAILKQRCSE